MENMGQIIQKHNAKILNDNKTKTKDRCSCREENIANCPLPKKCMAENIIYQATLSHGNKKVFYIGSTSTDFKQRYRNHTQSFRSYAYRKQTTLSRYIWDNNLNPSPNIKWKILKRCSTYTPGQKQCDLCLQEKTFIIKNLNNPRNINQRTDIGNKCQHQTDISLKDYRR